MNKTDNILWEKVYRDDDIASYEQLHANYYAALCNFTFSYLKDRQLCEEVISDVFVAVWQKRKELTHVRNIKSYLYTCAKNLSIDTIRKNNTMIQPDTSIYEVEIADVDEQLLSPLEMNEFKQKMNAAIEELPPQCKLIFKMLVNDQLAYKEIAEILNLSRKTVEAQIAIAYKKLTSQLKKLYYLLLFFINFIV